MCIRDRHKQLYEIMKNDEESIAKEALIAFCHATCNCGLMHIHEMAQLGVYDHLVQLMGQNLDVKLLAQVLESIEDFMSAGENMTENHDINPYVERLEALGGSAALEKLQNHENSNCLLYTSPSPRDS
eukprot:TRINITY_DN8303_c0_g1_i2.p2 TRINITY_DN8303_c0_g1~~TRINITY_DN8303_c0_g1_i2.p2  ORF type:complete len:128 (+),score=35.00 TRINITY_DN8303_c0_g1_i2:62-445(+)